MRFLAYVHAYVPFHNGGAETTLHDLMRTLADKGHEAVVVLKQNPYGPKEEYEIEGVKVIPSVDKTTIVRQLSGSDLILSHLECFERASLLGQNFNIPIAALIHNNMNLTKQNLSTGVNLIIYNTDWIKEDFSETFTAPSIVVHPPVVAERYKTTRGKKVTLVNLFESKGQDIFYELVKRMPDVEFLAAKGGYGHQIIPDRVPENLEISEYTPDIREVFQKTKIILMPSKYESYGRVACEAAASGIPSIVSPTPGLREALQDAGTYVDRSDVEGWETALRAMLTPRRYGAVSRLALARSEALDTMAREELSYFVEYLEMFVHNWKAKRG